MKTHLRIPIIVVIGLLAMTPLVQADDWDIYITVDNQYDVYFGTPTTTNFFAGGDTNWTTVDYYQALGRLPTDYLYVATASDYSTAQGFIGTFINTTTGNSINTGDLAWEVFPAGAYAATNPYSPGSWPSSLMPTQSEVDNAIAYATANNLWVAPTGATGYDNDPSTSILPNTWEWGWYFSSIDISASWIWYDSGNDTAPPTYAPAPLDGFNHDEFLVFRIAGAAVPEPTTLGLLLIGTLGLNRRKQRKF